MSLKDIVYSIASCLSCFPDPELQINNHRFRIRRLLGEGGFAYVYLVESISRAPGQSNQLYAVKKIRCPFGAESVRGALREVEAYKIFNRTRPLDSTGGGGGGVIRMVSSCVKQEPDGSKTVYIILPYFARGNLQDQINRHAIEGEHYDESTLRELFRGICQSLKILHHYKNNQPQTRAATTTAPARRLRSQQGDDSNIAESQPLVYDEENDNELDDLEMYNEFEIASEDDREGDEDDADIITPYVHGDIKPANIMLNDQGKPTLMDLGSCTKARITVTTRQAALQLQDHAAEHCTMPYRAPELFDVKTGQQLDERVDIWSLGCTLFALMYGHSPFELAEANSGATLSMAIMNGKYTFPTSPAYSEEIKGLVKMCLVLDPTKRPFVDDVLASLDSEGR